MRLMMPGARRIVAVAFALVAAIVIPSAVDPAPAEAEPVLGGQLYSTGGTIQIEVLPATAGLTSQLFLLEPEPEQFIATNREVGKIVELGPFEAGVELVFGIRVRGNEYRMGPAERNPDGIIHAQVDFIEDGVAIVGFEDLFGGGDRDYDDNVFRFTGDLAPEPPDPDPDPDPVPGAQPPVAVAGPDQSVPEGSTVQLDASGSSDPGAVGLVPSEETGNLPGGTALTASLTSLEPGAGATRAITGSAAVGEGVAVPDTALAYVLDLSGSAGFAGGCGGDQNNDGRSDRILDCEIASALELHEEVLAAGTVLEVGLVTFSSGASTRDLDPTGATASLIAPDADADGNGTLDLEQVMRTLRDGGATNFAAGVAAACNLLAGSTAPSKIAVFISDGEATRGGPVTAVLPCDPPVTFSGFAIGASHSCTAGATNAKLQDITDLTGGTCIDVPDVGDLPDILPGVVGSRILTASLTIDGGDPIDISDQLTPPLPVDGPASADFAVDIPVLGPGVHEVCLTVTGSDQGGEDSVTTCSLVTDVEGELSYRWTLINSVGPPIVLSSATAEMPTFLAIDDGIYTFELEALSVTGLTDTDTVTVTVTNLDPVVSADSREAFAGGVTLVTASLTDEGWLDVHDATIDWGDGSGAVPVSVSANGAGWGTVFGSHIYESAGTYDVVVTVTDDDGGTSSDTIDTLTVAEPVAIWANSETEKKTLDWRGGSGTVDGRIHSNNELRVVGAAKTVVGGTEYVTSIETHGNHTFDPPPTQVGPSDFPIGFDIADYAPGGPIATQVGDRYFDQSASCSRNEWHLNQEVLAEGVYYAPCDVHLNGSNIGGRVTLVATGSIKVSGSRPAFEPYYDGLLFLSGESGDKAVDIAASNSKFLGVIFARDGEISLSGSDNRFYCGILGDTIDIAGSGLDLRGAACGRPSSTVADPVLVPELNLLLEADSETALPGDGIDYDLTVTNNGALLVVPGVVGLENVDDTAATVQSYGYQLEYFSIADDSWVPLAAVAAVADGYTPVDPLPTIGGADVSFQQNPFSGVSYPGAGDAIIGTVLDPGGFATWGYQAIVELDPAHVELLLDPGQVGGVRNRIDFELTPAATQVRRLFRFGTDFIDQLRSLSGDITDVEITQTLPVGDPEFFDSTDEPALAVLGPGDSATVSDGVVVPTVSERAEGESDSAYLTRLLAADGDALASAAYARGLGGVGGLVAPQMFVITSEQVPVVAVTKTGPTAADAGALVEWDIQLNNLGSTAAASLAVTDELDGAPLTLTGVPAALAPSEVASLSVDHLVPADSDDSPLTNRAAATWADANGYIYGPLGSTVVTDVATAADVSATLVDTLQVDTDGNGLVSPGDTIRYAAVATNDGDQALSGVTFSAPVDANTAIVTGSVTTSQGTVTGGVAIDIGTLAGNSTVVIAWDAVIADPFPEGGNTTSTQGTVTSTELADLLTDDPAVPGVADPTVTTVSLPIPVLDATLSGALAVDADGNGVPSPGDTIHYTSDVANLGGGDATSVVAAYDPDGNSTLDVGSVTTTSGTIVGGNNGGDTMVQVDFSTIVPGATETLTFDVTINDPFPSGVDSIVLQGIVASNELQPVATDDPSTSAESDATSIPVFATGGGGPGGGGPAPTFGEVTPPEGEIVTEPVAVTGTITPPDGETIDSWQVIAYPAGGDPSNGLIVGSGSGAPSAVLGTFDPTLVANGLWTIRVEAIASGSGTSFAETDVIVEGQLKLGRYATTFQDMSVGVAGFPLQVLRTYDTLERFTSGDFGYGWSVDIADFRISTNGPLGDGGWTMFQCGGGLIFVPLCFESDSPHFVTVTWPDGLVETFDLTPAEGSTFFTGLTQAEFTGRTGTTSTLSAPDNGLFFTGDGNLYGGGFGTGGVYDPSTFVLTDRFGVKYTLQVGVGLLDMEDRNGNTLTFSDDGVVSSFGPGIDFNRDAQGRITSIAGPDGATVTYGYDAAGDLVSVTDQNGNTTALTYLVGHYLDDVVDPLGRPFRTLEYDTDGRLVAVVDGEGNRTELQLDVEGRKEAITDANGRRTIVTTRDERGNTIGVDEVFGGETVTSTFNYDSLSRLTSARDDLGNTWSVTYDADGNVESVLDPRGFTTTVEYSNVGLPTRIEDPLGGHVSFVYDSVGNLLERTDAIGVSQSFSYDAQGRLLTAADPRTGTLEYSYDGTGRVATITDARGQVTMYSHDDAGRVSQIAVGSIATSYAYNGVGQLTSVTGPVGTTTYVYDELRRLTSVTSPQGSVLYTYDQAGRRTSVTSDQGTISYGYDGDGTAVVTDWDGRVSTIEVDPDGQVGSIARPNGVSSVFSYDAARRPIGVRHEGPGGVIADFVYGLDENGNRTSVTSLAGTETYVLDALNRLTDVTYPNGDTASYEYDAAGNRLATIDDGVRTDYTYDSAGRLVNDGVNAYSYDAAGRVVARGDDSFVWGESGRLTGRTSGAESSTFAYDDAGLRTEAIRDGSTDGYLWDVVGSIPSLLAAGQSAILNVGPLTAIRDESGEVTYPLPDLVGSTRVTTDESGSIIGTFEYDVFGSAQGVSPPGVIGFAGEQAHDGLLYLRSRYVDTETGRFLSPDPVQPNAPSTQGWNLYSYVANNPTTWTDPLGNSVLVEYGTMAASTATTIGCYLSNLNPEVPPTTLGGAGIIGGLSIARAGSLGIIYGFQYGLPALLTLSVSLPFVFIGIALVVVGVIALVDICTEEP